MARKVHRRTKPRAPGIPLWQWSAAIAAAAVLYGAHAALTAHSNSTPAEGWLESANESFSTKYLATPCDVDRFGAGELSADRFDEEYRDKKPVIFRLDGADASTAALREAVGRAQLEAVLGDVPAAIMGRGLDDGEPDIMEEMPLRAFLAKLGSDAAHNGYLFDSGTFLQQCRRRFGWDLLSRFLDAPGHFAHFRAGGRAFFSIGGDKTGVPLHFHSAAFNLVLAGAKHWTLYGHGHAVAPGNVTFDPREHHLRWLEETLPGLAAGQRPLQCVQHVGDWAYIPAGWYHGTLNIGQTVSIAQQDGADHGIQRLYTAVKTGRPPSYTGPDRDNGAGDAAALERIARRDDVPIVAEVRNHLATRLFELQRLEEARHWFGRAIDANPRLGVAYKNKGVVLRAMGRAAEVADVARAALAERTGHKQLRAVLMDAVGAMRGAGDGEGAAAAKRLADTLAE